jgi:cystathionine beta-lyase/cystathionine gamma-synthase
MTEAPDHRRHRRFSTRSVHPPEVEQQPGDPLVPSIELASTYAFDDVAEFAEASRTKVGAGYVYARWSNRTLDALKAAVADLEAAPEGEVFSSGMAAISCAFLGLCSSGDRIVAARQLYGNTYSLLATRLPRYGIETTFLEVTDLEGIEAALPGAKFLYCETIGNPRVVAADIERLAELARAAGIPLVVDNTFASPVLCRPYELGASLVIHSATKFLGGHHDLLGGVAVGDRDLIAELRKIAIDLGPTLAPFNAWLVLRGMQTLPLRVERASANAQRVATWLAEHPEIERVYYPGLEGDDSHEIAARLFRGRGGGTLGFDLRGGRDRAVPFQEALRVISPAASLGGTHSLIVHAASVTHTQLSPEELASAGISEGFCRLSVGLEDPGDLIEDLEQALKA